MSRPWFPFYVGDYLKDTARLTTEAHGAYLLLMLDYWANGAPPDDDDVLATITKLPVTIWRKRRKSLAPFFDIQDGRWTHHRIDKERAKAADVGASNSDKARGAAERRWAKHRKEKQQASSEQCSTNAPSINQAMPQNAQSQSQSDPPCGREARAPAKRSDSGSGRGQSGDGTVLTLDFSPSASCRETIEAMGFAETQFNSEFSKFVAYYMARGYHRADWNAALVSWFQRATPDAKPSAPSVDLAIVNKVFVVEGTLEWACWSQHWKETRGVGWSRTIARHDENGHIQNGWWRPTRFPPGYDEATGERLEKKDDAA